MLRTRIKTLSLLLVLCIVLAACQSKERAVTNNQALTDETDLLLHVAMDHSNGNVGRSSKVFRGDFTRSLKSRVGLAFSKEFTLTYETNYIDTVFEEFLVEENQYVELGEPIARIRYEASELRLEELKIELKQNKEKSKTQGYRMTQEINDLETKIEATTDPVERYKLENQRSKLESDLSMFQGSCEAKEVELENIIMDYELHGSIDYILAPCSGITSRPSRIKPDTVLYWGQPLITIYDPASVLLLFEDQNSQLRYGMEVEVEVSTKELTENLVGKVVSGDNLVGEERRFGYAYIQLDNFDILRYMNAKINMIATTTKVEDVLLVEESAVSIEKGRTYIISLDKGKRKKVYFVSAGMNDTYYWVLEGLEEGMIAIQ